MWLTFCEGLQRVGNGWSFAIMMIVIVVVVIRFQKWQKQKEYETVIKLNNLLIEEDTPDEC
jgi:hypothetical protein